MRLGGGHRTSGRACSRQRLHNWWGAGRSSGLPSDAAKASRGGGQGGRAPPTLPLLVCRVPGSGIGRRATSECAQGLQAPTVVRRGTRLGEDCGGPADTMCCLPGLRGARAPPPLPLLLLGLLAAARPSWADGHPPGVMGAGRRRGRRVRCKGRGRFSPRGRRAWPGRPAAAGVGERSEDAGDRRWGPEAAASRGPCSRCLSWTSRLGRPGLRRSRS